MPLFNKYPYARRFRRRSNVSKRKGLVPSNLPSDATESMKTEIAKLVRNVPNVTARKAFESEMQSFLTLYERYSQEDTTIQWTQVNPPSLDQVIPYSRLSSQADSKALRKLAILKVNGGLGTSMGMNGAKSALEVTSGQTFLDLIVSQVEHLNKKCGVDVPLLLMTSFNTHEDTLAVIKRYANQPIRITVFNQSRYPRIFKRNSMPCPKRADDTKHNWYPPGHGDVYTSLVRSGVLEKLLSEGKEYLFISNSDNLGAVVDEAILQHLITSGAEFVMEVTDKTKTDIEGGTLIDYGGTLQLLEIAQVPLEYIEEFKSVRKFKTLNTNNLWINLKALKQRISSEGMRLDIIASTKILADDESILELETAAGAAIKYFPNAHAINVPRARFVPVKNCSDLLLVKSDIYSLRHGHLTMNPNRMFRTTPVIKLDDHFKKIQQFQKRFKSVPQIVDLDHLTVTGDVYFGKGVVLRGTVIVCANNGQRIDIPDGCILENRALSGGFKVIEL